MKSFREELDLPVVGEHFYASVQLRIIPSASFAWRVGVQKWRSLLSEPGSFWGITPSFALFRWWICYFELEGIRRSLEAEYNWLSVDMYCDVSQLDVEEFSKKEDHVPNFDSAACGTVNYYDQFESSDLDDVVLGHCKKSSSVRRSLEGELERLSVLENMDQDMVVSFMEDNLLFDNYSRDFWSGEASNERSEVLKDSDLMLCEDMILADLSEISGKSSPRSFLFPNSFRFSMNEFILLAASFGFVSCNSGDFEVLFNNFIKDRSVILRE